MSKIKRPSENEEEFFARREAEKFRTLAVEKAKAMAEAERERLRALHHMRCPKCGMELQEITFRGVTLDRCFDCGGTWLDAGELEELARDENQENGFLDKVVAIFKTR